MGGPAGSVALPAMPARVPAPPAAAPHAAAGWPATALAAPLPGTPDDTTLPPDVVAKLHQAAGDFEAMAIGQLLQPMFATVDTAHAAFGGGAGEAAWQPMLVDAIGKKIAAHGGFGLAAPVFAAMLRAQEAAAGQGLSGRIAAAKGAAGRAPPALALPDLPAPARMAPAAPATSPRRPTP
jgi:Rod binding domain-containing protein